MSASGAGAPAANSPDSQRSKGRQVGRQLEGPSLQGSPPSEILHTNQQERRRRPTSVRLNPKRGQNPGLQKSAHQRTCVRLQSAPQRAAGQWQKPAMQVPAPPQAPGQASYARPRSAYSPQSSPCSPEH